MAKKQLVYSEGVVHINATFNNTIITLTHDGDVLEWSSAGRKGFKGARKATPYAAQLAADDVAQKAIETFKMKRVDIQLSGPGSGRDAAMKAIAHSKLTVKSLKDVTRLPHNGCRARKKRRV